MEGLVYLTLEQAERTHEKELKIEIIHAIE